MMNALSVRAARQILAGLLCGTLILISPGLGWSSTVRSSLKSPARSFLPAAAASPRQSLEIPSALSIAALSGAAALPQAAAMPPQAAIGQAVERHPVIGLINELQAAGVDLQDTEPAGFQAAVAGMKESPAKAALLAFAGIHSLPTTSLPGALGQAYDNAAQGSSGGEGAFDAAKFAVPLQKLRWVPAAGTLPNGTRGLQATGPRIIGQDARVIEGLEDGLSRQGKHSNVVVTGPDASGRQYAVQQILAGIAPGMETPGDRVQVTNFEDSDKPIILDFPPGKGKAFAAAVKELVESFGPAIAEKLDSETLKAELDKTLDEFATEFQKNQKALDDETATLKFGKDSRFGLEVELVREDAAPDASGEERTNVTPVVKLTLDGEALPEKGLKKFLGKKQVAQGDYDQAAAELQERSREIIGKYTALLKGNQEKFLQLQVGIEMLRRRIVKSVLQQMAQPLFMLATNAADHNNEAHRAFHERAQERLAKLEQGFGKKRIGIFTVDFMTVQTNVGAQIFPVLSYEGKRVDPALYEQLKTDGKLTPADEQRLEAELKAAVEAYAAAAAAVEKENDEDHNAIHANDPPETPASRKNGEYVMDLLNDIVSNYRAFLAEDDAGSNPMAAIARSQRDPEERYRASALVTNLPGGGAPVVFEPNPTYERLFGTVENRGNTLLGSGLPVKLKSPGGPLFKAGSYLKANGGYLVLDLLSVLKEPGVYETLMKAITTGEVEVVEDGIIGKLYGREEVHHIPARVKVVFIGSPSLQMLLSHYDGDFRKYFDTVVEFDSSIRIAAASVADYVDFMKKMIAQSSGELMDMTAGAISSLLQYAARMADSNHKFSTRFGRLVSLMREASFFAKKAKRELVDVQDVDKAVARLQDKGLYGRRFHTIQAEGIFNIPIEGKEVGQINAMTVMGNFGAPSRVTVEYAIGKGGVVSSDRNSEMAGPTFKKGLEILQGYLLATFGKEKAFPFEVRVTKEQLYGGIDGDSSTSTNLYATLSSLSGVPIDQGIAITGSADQFGNVQAIGGVNQKIEGYFDVVKEKLALAGKEMDGSQGVIIPATNVGDLMLRPDIVQAVAEGRFKVYAVSHIRDGIQILTGRSFSEIKELIDQRADKARKSAKPEPAKPTIAIQRPPRSRRGT